MSVTTRFAPSPTGNLHVGNIRTALHNWMWTRRHGGTFVLRLDDTDAERSEERFAESIRADLRWLGLEWDAQYRQSERSALYERRFEELRSTGRVYACYETPQELELKRKILLGRGLPPVYDRGALDLTPEQIATNEAEGRQPHWRFKLDHASPIEWDDLVRGPQHFDPSKLSDPVIRRADGSWLYMLPSAIDDIDMGISHVVRGEDHVSNTAAQLQMFAALGATPPRFAHEALLVGSEGKLSKRLGSLGVEHFRGNHIEPEAVASLLARIGTSDPVEPVVDAMTLVQSIDFARFSRAPARFDETELQQLNQKIVHQMDFDAVAERLPAGMDAAGWDAVRPNVAHLGETADLWQLVTGPIEPAKLDEGDTAYIEAAVENLKLLDWDSDIWRCWTGALKKQTGRKGKALFLPLRRALTGLDHGPDMAALLPLIGRDSALERLTRTIS